MIKQQGKHASDCGNVKANETKRPKFGDLDVALNEVKQAHTREDEVFVNGRKHVPHFQNVQWFDFL